MLPWPDDLCALSLDELFRSQVELRLAQKELRLKTAALVNSRLARSITLEEYIAGRKQADLDSIEYKRRAETVVNEITQRHYAHAGLR